MKSIFALLSLPCYILCQEQDEPYGAALKYIPEELKHEYNFIDPKKKHEPDHGLTPEDFKPTVRDVKKKKTLSHIKKMEDHEIDFEDIPHEEHIINDDHHLDA